MTIAGLDDAIKNLPGAVLGPREIEIALGVDPFAGLSDADRKAAETVPFGPADLARAKADGELLVLRIASLADGPLTMLRLGEKLAGGLNPKVHTGVGYMLRDEWTIDNQPFAAKETCTTGWFLVRREPLPATRNLGYRAQDAVLEKLGPTRAAVARRRTAVEIAYDTLLWHRARGERLLANAWDWSCSESNDQGLAALGEFGDAGLGVIAYSRAVRFDTLGVCAQR